MGWDGCCAGDVNVDVDVDGIGGDETNVENRKVTFIVIYFVSIAETINQSISRIHRHYNLPSFPSSSYFSYSSSNISCYICIWHFDKLLISPPLASIYCFVCLKHHTILYRVYHTIPHHTTLYHTTLYHTTPHHTTQRQAPGV